MHIIQQDVPPENILAMAEAAHIYGGRSEGRQFRKTEHEGIPPANLQSFTAAGKRFGSYNQ